MIRSCLLASISLGVAMTLAGLAPGQAEQATTFYVSTSGNDAWSGLLAAPNPGKTDGPFATVAKAREAVRALKGQGPLPGPVTVSLRGGVYYLPETITFDAADSGTDAAPIVYASYPGETAYLSGGQLVRNWREVSVDGRRQWQTKLSAVQAGEWNFRQLFVRHGDEPTFTRRFRPMKGMLVVADLTRSPARKTAAHRAAQPDFIYFPGDLKPWANLDDVEVVALHSWSASRLKIAKLDAEKRIVTFTSVPTFRIGHWYKDERNPYFVENVKEELKLPGQWYLDRPTGTLTYLPLPGETMQNTTIAAPRLQQVVAFRGDPKAPGFVENLTFRGIGFLHSEWPLPSAGYDTSQGQPTLPAAVEATFARRIGFERCIVANTGAYGIGLGQGCQECAVVGCLMYDLGGGGVKVGDCQMAQKAEFPILPTDNLVENNTITDTGVMHYSANGIWCGIVRGTKIRHNEVRRNPYTGIAVGWNWSPQPTSCGGNIIERNHIHDVMQLLQDGGGIYTLGRQPGTIIRGNLVHDNWPSPFACENGQTGIYFDEGSSGFAVEDNVQYNVAWHPERINQNQNAPADHDIRTNYLGIRPGEKGFPTAIAAQAGVEKPFLWPLADKLQVTPNPVHAMKLPVLPPRPSSFALDFEDIPVGEMPRRFACNGASGGASIGVSEDTAASGKRSLKFQDRKGLPKTFYPYLSNPHLQVTKGPVALSFDIKLGAAQPACIALDLRDYLTQQKVEFYEGPAVSFEADGRMVVAGKDFATVPLGQWAHVSIQFALGDRAAREWEITLTLPDNSTKSAKLPFASKDFKVLTALMMSADADADGVAYVDNLILKAD